MEGIEISFITGPLPLFFGEPSERAVAGRPFIATEQMS